MDGFLVKDTLTVLTQNGECHIQLCLGDITKLKRKDKVDVIFISAFQGDYSPTPTSVIGALLRNLNINVRELSRDKEEDLRNLYHCWWSKPLPADKPFNRLLCFETKLFGSQRPQELVGDVFRCLVPILNNKDGTVITPLLSTGDQGFGRVVMLQGMVEAAVKWMKAGLPLRMLKIVFYCRSADIQTMEKFSDHRFMNVFKSFEKLKECYMMKDLMPKEVIIKFDVYLSFSKHDVGVVNLITNQLQSKKSDIRIFDSKQEMDGESVWQEDMYDVMLHSAKIITILTPNYLQCTSCIEQYNIAMCCSRKAMRNILAPFYIEESPLPTYMTQVQYVDCRSSHQERISLACHQIVISLGATLKATPPEHPSLKYDVFISYSHADDERANRIVKALKDSNPELRIFFDIQELKTDISVLGIESLGHRSNAVCLSREKMWMKRLRTIQPHGLNIQEGIAWQKTLYHSIDECKVMLALISNKYLSSAVCQEEYNLALAKHCSESDSLRLVPLCIEDITEVRPEFTKVKMVNAKGANFSHIINTTCLAVLDWMAGRNVDSAVKPIFESTKDMTVDISAVTESMRRVSFKKQYGDDQNLLRKNVIFPAHLPVSMPECMNMDSSDEDQANRCDVAFSYAIEDKKYALFLAELLNHVRGITVKIEMLSDHERFALIEKAQHIIAILSPHYIDSMEKCEEFNIALSRQRMSTSRILFPIHIHVLPHQPTYFHLVPCSINTADKVWPELCTCLKVDTCTFDIEDNNLKISRPTELALHEAAYQILQEIQNKRLSTVLSVEKVKASPTLLNVKQLKHEVDHAFHDVEDNAGQYLLPQVFNDTCGINTAERPSVDKVAEHQLEMKPHFDAGQSSVEEPHSSASIKEGSFNDQHITNTSQPAATDELIQEQHVNTDSVQSYTPHKELDNSSSVSTFGEETVQNIGDRGGIEGQSAEVRVDANSGNKMKGSSSCTFI